MVCVGPPATEDLHFEKIPLKGYVGSEIEMSQRIVKNHERAHFVL